jgi:hypothetical protein
MALNPHRALDPYGSDRADRRTLPKAAQVAREGETFAARTDADGRTLGAQLRPLAGQLQAMIRDASRDAVTEAGPELRAYVHKVADAFAKSLAKRSLDAAGAPRAVR